MANHGGYHTPIILRSAMRPEEVVITMMMSRGILFRLAGTDCSDNHSLV
jgi:hypothetical protein